MSYQITGKLIKKFEVESKTASFQTREFVIQTEEQYPQFVKFQLTQDRCNIIDKYNENEPILVHFDLKGREWQGKYFTNLNAWRVENGGESQVKAGENVIQDAESPDPFSQVQDYDDLPF
ncbi:MAG: DUF3127 domain-containing protein [Bacteroidota bacterium]|nr:DUF3127 domain-containing protein [Bacteroidota bacterium]